ncbi:hypothetical protein KC19_1G036700 [Ceratodon purpureus]|uniref:tRNA (guanine-N(7)-)-methyltransferase non-catalytic subunit n=1 Tax=Ceratodon purpureus TaxID=3225 RepID=A0A8T0J136_CERPU|nr:hypothetical protein KC19_1G036700 [Ceratodon purpureus]
MAMAMEDHHGTPPQHPQHVKSKSVAPALITVSPGGAYVVVAIGAHLRIFDFTKQSAVEVEDSTTPALHGDAIRSVAFSVDGLLFATVGDDKRVKLWDAKTWTCIKTICLTKKVSAVTFSNDSAWFMVADKFGIVYVFSTSADSVDEPVQLLAHCCSIITDMICSPDGKYIVTSDRDFKIRVTGFPERPLAGAHEIHTYCLGHNNFVTCLAFAGSEGLLLSGGGDCMIRLWEYESGTLLDTFDTTQGDLGNSKEGNRAVLALAASPTESSVAAILERFEGVLIFTCDVAEKSLKLLKKVETPGYSPSGLSFDCEGNLWLVAGAAETVVKGDEFVTPEAVAAAQMQAQAIALAAVTHVQVVRDCSLLDGASVPGGDALLRTLQGSEADVTKVQTATEAAELAMKDLLTKRQYSTEQRENRKRMRNDKKVTSITSA